MAEEKARLEAEAEARRKAEEEAAAKGKDANNSPRPNIKLRDKATPATIEGEVYPVGVNPILLPNLESQREGFYHPRAAEIIRLYPDRYIAYVEKGGKS
jgi:hypothetical protein